MERVYMVRVSMTPFGKFLDKSVRDSTRKAGTDALRDANCEAGMVDAAFFANSAQGAMDISLVEVHDATALGEIQ